MTQPLTDARSLTQKRRRAARDPALFLHEAAIDEIRYRLDLVNRTFRDVAVVTGWPGPWGQAFAGADCVPDDEVLALAPGTRDLVIHAMGLHWANDPVGQLIQCRRALRPDGLLLAVCPGGETLNELRAALAGAEIAETGGLSPRVAPMPAIRDLGALMQRAGLALPVADAVPLTVSYRSARHLMHDLRAMGEANALTGRLRRPTRRGVFARAGALYAEHYADGEGRVRATFELMVLTGWAPHPDQPQPLRPGSATARLADALRTAEIGLEE